MSEWQPIETAPKDGTHLLILWSRRRWGAVVCESFWWRSGDAPESHNGWVKECGDHKGQTPLFWMPMPAPLDDAQNAVRVAKQATGED